MRKGRATVLRLHLAVALLAGAGLVLVSLSGAALVFRPELDDAVFGGPVRVERGGAPASLPQLVDAGSARHPGLSLRALTLPETPGHPARLQLAGAGGELVEVLLDPASARVLGSRWLERSPLHALHTLHTELYLGTRGRLLVAALGVLLVAQGATGLFLWWPFTRRLPRGFTIRRGRRWPVVGYDLHKLVGVVSLAFNVPMALTGTLLALSATAGTDATAASAGSALTVDQVVRRLQIIWPEVSIVSLRIIGGAVEARERDGGVARVDRRSGAVSIVSDPRRPGDRLWALVAPLHEGRFGGALSRWLYVAGGLTPAVLALTGFGIWLTRPRAFGQTGQGSRRQPISQNIHS
jgi:uncharacterized iron-regulated membrane protein